MTAIAVREKSVRAVAPAGRGTYLVAVAWTFLAAVPVPGGGITYRFGLVLGIALFPLMWRSWVSVGAMRWVVGVAFLTTAFGLFVGIVLRDVDQPWSFALLASALAQMATILVTGIGLLWAIRVIGARTAIVFYAFGLIVAALLTSTRFADNPWKFGLALPVSLIVLALFGAGRKWVTVFLLVFLVGLSIVLETRSWMIVVVGALTVYLLFHGRAARWSAVRKTVVVVFSLAAIIIFGEVVSNLGASGALGAYIQDRTLRSLETSGNAVIGNREEWGGALALFQARPLGIGTGVGPSTADFNTVVNGLFLPDALKPKSNVADSLREGYFSFHSGMWNIFSQFAVAGLVFVVFIMMLLGRGIVEMLTEARDTVAPGPRAAAVVLMVAVTWDLLFSPLSPWNVGAAIAVAVSVLPGGPLVGVRRTTGDSSDFAVSSGLIPPSSPRPRVDR